MHRLGLFKISRAAISLILCAHLSASIAACDRASDHATRRAGTSAGDLIEEARTFMDAYARDLLAGNRAAIVARYDRDGVYFLGNGHKEFAPYDSVSAKYNGANWSPPASFAWRDLSFEPAGPDAIVVAGQFTWGAASAPAPVTLSYTALLRRQDDSLRIRLEDESIDPASVPARPPRDSARK